MSLLSLLIFLNTQSKFTIPLGIIKFSDSDDAIYGFAVKMAGATVAILPIIIIYLFLQRYFIEGIASSGIKG